MKHPDPGERPESDFERAGPIDSPKKWIPLEPALQLIPDLSQEIVASGEQERLSQQHQMLMPIQLPDNFVVANFVEVEIGDAPEVDRTTRTPAQIITAPIDLLAGRNLKSKQRKLVSHDLVRKARDGRREGCVLEQGCGVLGRKQAA